MTEQDVLRYENFLSQEDWKKMQTYLDEDKWEFGSLSYPPEKDRTKQYFPFWNMALEQSFFTVHLLKLINKTVDGKYTALRCYCNGMPYGSDTDFHIDDYQPDTRTALLYANKEWKQEWGGKTVFGFDNRYHYVEAIPNSLIIFPSNIYHRAEPVTRHYTGLRKTVAWKLIKDK